MKIIGLCGGSGSGKGSVCAIFDKLGIPSIDTDAVYRELTSKDSQCMRALSSEFGDEIISPDGSLNRGILRKVVFEGDDAGIRLKRLNEISHKYILDRTREILDAYREKGYCAAIVDAPVLFESGFDKECDIIISVTADKDIRVERIIKRDGIDRNNAEARIASQLSDDEVVLRSDFVIQNNSDLVSLEKRVTEVAKQILEN